MPLSKEEIDELTAQFRAELEAEHQEREARAQRRSERRKNKKKQRRAGRNREEEALKDSIRASFYEEHGYEEKIDPTGRSMYLSPTEIENKKRKRRSKKSQSRMVKRDLNKWYVHLIIAGMGIVTALMLVRSM